MTAFANCTRSEALQIDFKHIQDTCEAYKKYLIAKWHMTNCRPNGLTENRLHGIISSFKKLILDFYYGYFWHLIAIYAIMTFE